LVSEYIFFGGKRVARVDISNSTHPVYYISDHLGSTTVLANDDGTPKGETMYYPYGGVRWSNVTDTNHYKFTGKERDTETGMDYFGARYYGSNMGRWMSPDWAGSPVAVPYANYGDPRSLNLYGYVRNNPASVADPDGHDTDGHRYSNALPYEGDLRWGDDGSRLVGHTYEEDAEKSNARKGGKGKSIPQSQMGASGTNFELAWANLILGFYVEVIDVKFTGEVVLVFKLQGPQGQDLIQYESLESRARGGSKEYGTHATFGPNGEFIDSWNPGSGRPSSTSVQTYYFANPA
jgi:RHS repeat-associated protein